MAQLVAPVILSDVGISTAVKPHTTSRKMLVHPEDRIADERKSEVMYKTSFTGSVISVVYKT